ncbi:MAG: hypothetical protein JWQ81_2208 [Amycolatopsis sp.]|nr:hypothetical protein [Amycolatopsis sp.]
MPSVGRATLVIRRFLPLYSANVDKGDHGLLARWAADCAERVLIFFEDEFPGDKRPREAVEAAQAWACGELTVGDARIAAFGAHAAARDTVRTSARAAARAAGHAAETAYVVGNARHAATYAATALGGAERDWQRTQLATHLWPIAFPPRQKY